MPRRGRDDFSEEDGATGVDSKKNVTGAVNWHKAMNALEMAGWTKVRRNKKSKVARPNDKPVVGARMIYKRNMKSGEIDRYRCRLAA